MREADWTRPIAELEVIHAETGERSLVFPNPDKFLPDGSHRAGKPYRVQVRPSVLEREKGEGLRKMVQLDEELGLYDEPTDTLPLWAKSPFKTPEMLSFEPYDAYFVRMVQAFEDWVNASAVPVIAATEKEPERPDPLQLELEAALWDISRVKLTDLELASICRSIRTGGWDAIKQWGEGR